MNGGCRCKFFMFFFRRQITTLIQNSGKLAGILIVEAILK